MAGLGDRLRSVRKRQGLTQRELAALSGVSISLIRKIEQGEVTETRLETLRKLALALHVSTTTLAVGSDAERATPEDIDRWAAVRNALSLDSPQPEESSTLQGVTTAFEQLTPLFRGNRFSAMLPVLPALIRDAQALGEDGRSIRGRILTLTGGLLVHTHQYEAAESALTQALADARDSFDASAAVHNLTWLLVRRGQLDECIRLSTRWADDLEPKLSSATHRELAAWGWMLIRIAMAAIRNNQPDESADAMRLAKAAALVAGREFQPAGDFLRPFGPLLVQAKQAELAMVDDQPDRVLALSAGIPPASIVPTSDNWNRHLLDVANAQVRLGLAGEAVATMFTIRARAPEWLVQQRYARDIVRSMIERRRRLTEDMRALADAVRLTY
ncbi:helix-turn-helix domain-containing protein [Catellatospora vulcania]|uniref:helix-turn-helix domain-containing protein n=1 Tax=Catellatospora vulcania TaxID=1460450 RepID=UPI0012D4AFF2|nr:helix-turn-helix transcriptional regulator [Catellatospora vulcania]